MIQSPARSQLFPYTTLFRSAARAGATAGAVRHAAVAPDGRALLLRRVRAADRKSTRLNSSHGYISYAVFCLKKKTNNLQNAPNPHKCTNDSYYDSDTLASCI